MSLQSLPGRVYGSPRLLITGSDGWLLNIIVPRSSFLVGPSTDGAPVAALRPQTNFLTLLSLGLAIRIHGSEPRGRRAKDWPSSLRIVEPWLFSMAWSRSKIRPVHKKGAYVSLLCKRFCASLLPSIGGFASLPPGCPFLILPITSAPRPCVVSWNNYLALPVRSCSEHWVLRGMRRSCEGPATSSAAILLRSRC